MRNTAEAYDTAERDRILQKQLLIESRITNDGKSLTAAYVLWWFLGIFGAHRFYVGKNGTAIMMLLLTIIIIGLPVTLIWWVIDAFLIPDMIRKSHQILRNALAYQML